MTTLVLSSSTLLISLAHSRSSLSVNNGGRPFYREVPSVRPSIRQPVFRRARHTHTDWDVIVSVMNCVVGRHCSETRDLVDENRDEDDCYYITM